MVDATVGKALRAAVGAVVGGIAGFFACVWLAGSGLYAPMLPGALLGAGCALLLQESSKPAGILCAVAAVPLGLVCEWRIAPFIADPSFAYFITHLHELKAVSWILILLGAVFAYWLGKGRDDLPRPEQPPQG